MLFLQPAFHPSSYGVPRDPQEGLQVLEVTDRIYIYIYIYIYSYGTPLIVYYITSSTFFSSIPAILKDSQQQLKEKCMK
jgi:hypothetical protein